MAACDSFRTEEVIKAISQDEYSDLDEISEKGNTSSEHGTLIKVTAQDQNSPRIHFPSLV